MSATDSLSVDVLAAQVREGFRDARDGVADSEKALDALVARVTEAERRAERGADAETEKIERGTEILRLRAALADARNALERIAAHPPYPMTGCQKIAIDALARLDGSSE